MFAQLIASRVPRRRSPGGFAASVALHGILVAGAVVATAHVPVRHAPRAELLVTYVAPAVRPHAPAPTTPAGALPVPAAPRIINVPLTVPDGIPPIDPLRTAIGADDPFIFRVGVPSQPAVPGPAVDDPGAPFLDTQVEVPVAFDPRSPMPRYPQLLKDAGVEGLARLRFVVDTLGRVEPGTVHVVESTHPAFALAVQAALPGMRFTPARVGNHKVRQLVEFPLEFKLHR